MFNSETGAIARQNQVQSREEHQSRAEHARNESFKQKFYKLKQKFIDYVKQKDQPCVWSKIMNFCKNKYNILYEHISNIHVSTSSRGNRFQSEKLRQFFILISFHGQSLLQLLKKTFGFLSWKSTMKYKKQLLEKYEINLDGSEDSIIKLTNTIYGGEIDDKRIVLAIDAVSISPNISVSSDGEVTGLIDLNHIQVEDAAEIIKTPEDFAKFVEAHASQAIRYFFVIYMCPLNPQYMSIPICIIPQTAGNANKDIRDAFDNIVNNLNEIGFDVAGEAFDGDPGWLTRTCSYAQELCKNILQRPDLTLAELADIAIQINKGTYIYEDLMHLVKCDRYRKVSGADICPTLYKDKPTISKDSYEQSGIPRWILDNKRYTKMDDTLPLKFFTFQNILHFRSIGRKDLAFSIIPSTLLIEAVLNEHYSKEQRLELLSYGFSIVYIYYTELLQYSSNENQMIQKTSKAKGEGKCVTLYEKKFCQKYLTLCSSLSHQISQNGCVDLGALGSHHLEHFFGAIRRVSRGDDSAEQFLNRCYDSILKHVISRNLDIDFNEMKRVSSSGVFLEEEEEGTLSDCIHKYIQVAWCLYNDFRDKGEFFDMDLYKLATNEGNELYTEEEAFGIIAEILECGQVEKKIKVISAKKERMIIRSGLINDKRLAEGNQISKMISRSYSPSTIIIEVKEKKGKSKDQSDNESFNGTNEMDDVQEMIENIENEE